MVGGFEVLRLEHWSFAEMKKPLPLASMNTSHGAYPGAAALINDEARWRDYIVNALAETVLLKDIRGC